MEGSAAAGGRSPDAAALSREAERHGVALLAWPAEAAWRERLACAGIPRLLVVRVDGAPPTCPDPLEDWVREPLDIAEVDVRALTLARRAEAGCGQPRLDDHGVLRVHQRRVDLPAAQVPVVRLLVARFAQLVPVEEIRGAYVGAGGSDHPKAFRAMIARVKRRVAELDLCLTCVRDRGYLLVAGPPADRRT